MTNPATTMATAVEPQNVEASLREAATIHAATDEDAATVGADGQTRAVLLHQVAESISAFYVDLGKKEGATCVTGGEREGGVAPGHGAAEASERRALRGHEQMFARFTRRSASPGAPEQSRPCANRVPVVRPGAPL